MQGGIDEEAVNADLDSVDLVAQVGQVVKAVAGVQRRQGRLAEVASQDREVAVGLCSLGSEGEHLVLEAGGNGEIGRGGLEHRRIVALGPVVETVMGMCLAGQPLHLPHVEDGGIERNTVAVGGARQLAIDHPPAILVAPIQVGIAGTQPYPLQQAALLPGQDGIVVRRQLGGLGQRGSDRSIVVEAQRGHQRRRAEQLLERHGGKVGRTGIAPQEASAQLGVLGANEQPVDLLPEMRQAGGVGDGGPRFQSEFGIGQKHIRQAVMQHDRVAQSRGGQPAAGYSGKQAWESAHFCVIPCTGAES